MPITSKSKLSSHYYKAWWERVLKFGLYKRRTVQEIRDKIKSSYDNRDKSLELDEDVQKYLDEARDNILQEWKQKKN